MGIFITGTGTDIGKTVIATWLCLHTQAAYFKPIQCGEEKDSDYLSNIADVKIFPCAYDFKAPLSPHLASEKEGISIKLENINIPNTSSGLIVEGAGGVLVPINQTELVIDLIKKINFPVIVVADSRLGTINHTCLTLMALGANNINVLGVIMNGELNLDNKSAIEMYGKTQVLDCFPRLPEVNHNTLSQIPLSLELKNSLNKNLKNKNR